MRMLALALAALVLAAPASAAGPRFGVFDLDADLAKASHNVYGDVHVAASRTALARKAPAASLVRCGAGCRLGRGWLAFAKAPSLRGSDVGPVSGKAHLGRRGWSVDVRLSKRGAAAWKRLAAAARRHTARTGLQSVYAIVVDGAIVATPFANDLRVSRGTLALTGFTRSGARLAARRLG
jgi:hypothetical protein